MKHTLTKLLKLAYRNLFRNRRRSLFTIMIAAIGFTAMALTMGYFSFSVFGLQEMTISLGFSGEGGTAHLQIADVRTQQQEEEIPLEFGISNYERLIQSLEKLPEVDYVLPRIKFGGLISNGDKSMPFNGYGIDPVNEAKLRDRLAKLREGFLLGFEIIPLDTVEDGIILGASLAESLNAKTGDYLMLYGTTVDGAVNAIDVQLIGTMNTGLSIVDKFYVATNIATVQRLINTRKISHCNVICTDRDKLTTWMSNISPILSAYQEAELKIVPWYDMGMFYNSIRDIFKLIFTFNGIIILTIVVLSCWNVINMTTMERSREIGTLRAIGLKIKYIIRVFLMEAFILGIAGVIAGIILQLIITYSLNAMGINMPPIPGQSRSYLLQIDPITTYHFPIALAVVLATTLSGLSSFFIIKKMSIIESLDHV